MPEPGRTWPAGGAEIGRSILAVVSSLVAFVVVSLLAFLVALLLFDGIVFPMAIGIFCGFAVATVLNATDVLARRTRRQQAGDRDNQREDGRAP